MERDPLFERAVAALKDFLDSNVVVTVGPSTLHFRHGTRVAEFRMIMPGEGKPELTGQAMLPFDYLLSAPAKVAALVRSRLGMNKRVFARSCEVAPVPRSVAAEFVDRFHLMGSTSSAWNLGLFHSDELLCVAAFSKGRKMRRLHDDERSYELIRFCCRDGYTVTGGLSRLVKTFCRQRPAGEIMTYVDRQFSEGKSFASAGFRTVDVTPPRAFLVDRLTFARAPGPAEEAVGDNVIWNAGNIKMIYRCR